MKSIISITLFCICCLTSFTACSDTKTETDIQIQNCSHSKTQADMDACRESAYGKATKKLGKLVNKLSKSYESNEPRLKPIFQDAQEKWETFVNAECDFNNYYSRGGAGYNAYFLSCMELHTLKRIRQLEKVLATP